VYGAPLTPPIPHGTTPSFALRKLLPLDGNRRHVPERNTMRKFIKIILLWPADLGSYIVVMAFALGNFVKLDFCRIFAYDGLTRKPTT
jgi:hypothetical protein